MKMQITGASNFVNRMFQACGSYQWAREFLKNSIEAGATRAEFGVAQQAFKGHEVFRRTIADNGKGMTREQLVNFFSTLGAGGKDIGGVHENFGVGAKISSLPWNPQGVVVISYSEGKGSMIWIVLDEATGDYELVEFSAGGGLKSTAIDPDAHEVDGFKWGTLRPAWLKEHGTVVVLLGSELHPDTVIGNPEAGETDIKGLSSYLNSRFWAVNGTEVWVEELRSINRATWGTKEGTSRRQIHGARHWLVDAQGPKGKLKASDSLLLANGRVKAEWYLWTGERPAIHSYARRPGYIAIRYAGELFEITSGKVDFRAFGVVESRVQANLTIVLEPQHLLDGWGVHPDQSRNRMIFTSEAGKGKAVPLYEWGREFAEMMPLEILEAIQDARSETSGTIDSEEYRKRLQDKFGNRWLIRKKVLAAQGEAATASETEVDASIKSEFPALPETEGEEGRGQRKLPRAITRKLATPLGSAHSVEAEEPMDVPRYRFSRADAFERPWHLAMWVPHDIEGPTVLLNVESHVLTEIVRYHQNLFPDVYAEEVAEMVRKVFGEVAACKIAHSQKLARLIPEEELDRDYRNEGALTVGLMGLLAEESVITSRLSHKLGKRAPAAEAVMNQRW